MNSTFPVRGGLLALVLSLSACGGSVLSQATKYPVKGRVTVDGVPLPFGLVEFCRYQSSGAMDVESAVVEEGQFQMDAPAGEHLVRVSPAAPEPHEMEKASSELRKRVIDSGGLIPEKYHVVGDLKVSVQAGDANAPEIDLKSTKKS